MKTKYYKFDHYTFKAYYKTVGNGYEVGVYCNNKPVFVGNFIHKTEGDRWWKLMNRTSASFFHKYYYENMPTTWFTNFYKNHMYAIYYKYLDKMFAKYNYSFDRAYKGNVKQFAKYKKQYHHYKKSA